MTDHTSFGCHLAYLAGGVVARASEAALGLIVIVAGLALTATVFLMPIGAFVALLGVILFIGGSNGTAVVWVHLRGDYDARHHLTAPCNH